MAIFAESRRSSPRVSSHEELALHLCFCNNNRAIERACVQYRPPGNDVRNSSFSGVFSILHEGSHQLFHLDMGRHERPQPWRPTIRRRPAGICRYPQRSLSRKRLPSLRPKCSITLCETHCFRLRLLHLTLLPPSDHTYGYSLWPKHLQPVAHIRRRLPNRNIRVPPLPRRLRSRLQLRRPPRPHHPPTNRRILPLSLRSSSRFPNRIQK